eukprot:Skav208036  [mRNA]  locus=scaffold2540:71346:73007:+ [translate_table: standard]
MQAGLRRSTRELGPWCLLLKQLVSQKDACYPLDQVDALLPIGTHVLKLEEGKERYEMDLNGMQVSLQMKDVEQQPLEQDW